MEEKPPEQSEPQDDLEKKLQKLRLIDELLTLLGRHLANTHRWLYRNIFLKLPGGKVWAFILMVVIAYYLYYLWRVHNVHPIFQEFNIPPDRSAPEPFFSPSPRPTPNHR